MTKRTGPFSPVIRLWSMTTGCPSATAPSGMLQARKQQDGRVPALSWTALTVIPGPGLCLLLRTLTEFSEECLSGIVNSWLFIVTGKEGGKKAMWGWIFISEIHKLLAGVWAGEWAPERTLPSLAAVAAYQIDRCLQTSPRRAAQAPWEPALLASSVHSAQM